MKTAVQLLQALENHCQNSNRLGPHDHSEEGRAIRKEVQEFLALEAANHEVAHGGHGA